MQTIIDTADAADSLWMNQIYTIAAGGDFWESGGQLSTAGSSTDIQLSVSSATVNIGGEPVSHGSQPVTLSATGGEYRSDVIYADSAGISKVEGVEMPKLPSGNQFPNVWQPAPNNGSLVPGVPLWVVHVTPEDAASADIASWQMQNRRMNAEEINTDAVVALLEDYGVAANGPIQTTVQNSAEFGGRGHYEELYSRTGHVHTTQVSSGGETRSSDNILVPSGRAARLWSVSVNTADGTESSDVFVGYRVNGNRSYNLDTTEQFETGADGGGGTQEPWLRSTAAGDIIDFEHVNNTAESKTVTSRWVLTFE